MGVLLQSGALSGPRGIALSIEARMAADRSGAEFYLLAGPDGQRIAGNLSGVPRDPGWREGTIRLPDGSRGAGADAGRARCPAAARWWWAATSSAVRALEQRLLSVAAWVGGAVLLLGLGGGLLIGRGVARRAAAMDAALAAVQAGDLDRRLPVGRGGDEFDRLARAHQRHARPAAVADGGAARRDRRHRARPAHAAHPPAPAPRCRRRRAHRRGDRRRAAGSRCAARHLRRAAAHRAGRIRHAARGLHAGGPLRHRAIGRRGLCPGRGGARPDADGGHRAWRRHAPATPRCSRRCWRTWWRTRCAMGARAGASRWRSTPHGHHRDR